MDVNPMKYTVVTCLLMFCCHGTAKDEHQTQVERKQKDPFYTISARGDLIRFPLIKPYEVVSFDDGAHWMLQGLATPERISDINTPGNIKEIFVTNGIMLIHSVGETILMGQEIQEAWYVIMADQSIVKGFSTLSSFNAFIANMQVNEVGWVSSQKLFEQFDTTVCLPWIKGC